MADSAPDDFASDESTVAVLERVDRWASEGRLGDALAACRALALRLDGERDRLAAELLHRRQPDRRVSAPWMVPEAGLVDAAARARTDTGADALTGLPTRRHLETGVVQLAQSLANPQITLLLVEIDHFAQIALGGASPLGDAVLQAFAGLLRAQSRPLDLLARVGGETFVVAFGSAISLTRATLVAERLRAAVETHDWSSLRPGLRITASIGVAGCTPGESLDVVLARAGAALDECQRAGRNQVRCAS